MANIDYKYNAWKNKLLDLGKRNRLLNYKDTAFSNVKIESPDCSALWEMFVKNEKSLYFEFKEKASKKDEDEESALEDASSDDENSEAEFESNVKTNKKVKDLLRALRNLRTKAKTAIEEQGVNVLYLSFGFLKWTESETSDQTFLSLP